MGLPPSARDAGYHTGITPFGPGVISGVPEPGTLAMTLAGIVAFAYVARRRRR